ncbi:MAG: Tex-like N-terminal domain-containing protein [Planctomycetota bacterium]|nr:Tex-like N-terminal domain-containing protein [Planctomycetota bacterium]
MTAKLILNTLAKEFSIKGNEVQAVLEMTDAGLHAPFIARVRRSKTGGLTESQLRRLIQRRTELDELDRRRGTILRQLEKMEDVTPAAVTAIENCSDRFELEDLFVPHRRPEPEVQLAMDRGLTALADELVKSMPKGARPETGATEAPAEAAAETPAVGETAVAETVVEAPVEAAPEAASEAPAEEPAEAAPVEAVAEAAPETAAPEAAAPEAAATEAAATEAPVEASIEAPDTSEPAAAKEAAAPEVDTSPAPHIHSTEALTLMCQPFVNPDRGIHSVEEALSGAVRILSDRLGRNAALRTTLRRMLRKRGTVEVHASVPMDKMGRHKALARFKSPLKQVQGHRLIALRQAQRERVLAVHLSMEQSLALSKVRAALGRHTDPMHEELLQEIARRAYLARLLPVIEADVRLELKERSDAEALRFLCNHLRQLMFTPTFGRRPVCGVDVSAKGDWVLAFLDEDGNSTKTVRIEVGEKDDAALLVEMQAALDGTGVQLLTTGHDKRARVGTHRMRKVLAASEGDYTVTMVNDTGLGSYANSEIARKELETVAVPERMAISLGRRLQNPMAELLKVDPRHLGLGSEQGLVSKANLKRALNETVESCVAHVGCDVNLALRSELLNMPSLDEAAVDRIFAARANGPIASRESLRTDQILTEAQWTNVAAFLRVPNSPEPLDRTCLHPELYGVARELLQSVGGSVEENLGNPGVTRGLRREAFNVDENTWRDLMRELSRPGRDPRSWLMRPRLMSPATDPAMITKDRVVEGIVTSVASFGAFVDMGLEKDAIVHISQISSRYIRDARELLSIGQVVRARITDPSGQRITLSLKDVPAKERASGGGGGRRRGGGRGGRGGRGRERDPREGLRKGDARGMRLGGAKNRRGGPRKERGDSKEGRGERVDLRKLNAQSEGAAASPFAHFFKKEGDGDKK